MLSVSHLYRPATLYSTKLHDCSGKDIAVPLSYRKLVMYDHMNNSRLVKTFTRDGGTRTVYFSVSNADAECLVLCSFDLAVASAVCCALTV